MDHTLHVERTVDDLTDATIAAMEATGTWARNVTTLRVAAGACGLMAVIVMSLVGGASSLPVFAALMIAVTGVLVWRAPATARRSFKRRMPRLMGDQLQGCTGPRTLRITDAGLSDTGSGITTTVAWDRITHHVVTPQRHVFCAGLAQVTDVPRRGQVAAVDAFAAQAAARMQHARQGTPA